MRDRFMQSRAKELRPVSPLPSSACGGIYAVAIFPIAGFVAKSPGPSIADFACLRPRLVVEIDGGQHGVQADYD